MHIILLKTIKKWIVGLLMVMVTPLMLLAGTTLWQQDFEGDWSSCWHVDAGTWEVGMPTSGPGEAYSGSQSVATILTGDYGAYVDSRLIRHCTFVVPPAYENPCLRFQHWYYFQINNDDYGRVQIRAVGETNWVTLAEYRNHGGFIWSQPKISLSDYAGQEVELCFYFHSNSGYNYAGWYIDDVSVETGEAIMNSPEGWEAGFGDWYVSNGTWEAGEPTTGPKSAHNGSQCVATRLDQNYSDYVDSRLISPPFIVPDAEESPRLRLWHWYYFQINNDDYGRVQIRIVGETDWITLAEYRNHGGGIWSRPKIDLSDYAGQEVELCFYLHSNSGYNYAGWYIDDVSVETGEAIMNSPEGWEAGFGDWYVSNGTWDVGTPTSGPGRAHEGSHCVATRLDQNYLDYVDSRLISPAFYICPGIVNPVLRFWHWYYFQINNDDYGCVQIRVVGESDWITLAEYRNHSGGIWSQPYITLRDYMGEIVELSFFIHSNSGYNYAGWYIDDIELQSISPVIEEISLERFIPSPCTSTITISAHDPCGGELFYEGKVLTGDGQLTGRGNELEFEPSETMYDPHQLKVWAKSSTSGIAAPKLYDIYTIAAGDLDTDHDVDGLDAAKLSQDVEESILRRFADEFGLVGCRKTIYKY